MSPQNTTSLSQQIFHGTKWYMAMRWSIKGLGFISSAVLARLLVPEDFGLIAMVFVIFGLISLLFEFGVNWALIQNNQATDDHFHTAWTLQLLQSTAIALLLAVFSPEIASFYHDVRLEAICQIMAVGTLIRGFGNIGVIKFQKEMRFSRDFAYNVIPKFFSIAITISLAFYFRSYMALVVAMAMNSVIVVIISYLIIDFRPKLSFKKISDIWGFSQWVLFRNIALYINEQGAMFFLSVLTTPVNVGYYKWGSELSTLTISEIQFPFSRALLPGLAKIKNDPDRLIGVYLKALGIMALVAAPVALGFGAVARELVPVFLGGGDKWLPVVPIIQGLVFSAMAISMYDISSTLLTVSGNVKYTAYIFWIQALLTMIVLYPAYYLAGLPGIAYSNALTNIVMFFVVSLYTVNRYEITFGQIANVVWRPVVAGIGMFVILVNMFNMGILEGWIILIIKIIFGVVLYIFFIVVLWWLAGRPDSAEQLILGQIAKNVRKRLG